MSNTMTTKDNPTRLRIELENLPRWAETEQALWGAIKKIRKAHGLDESAAILRRSQALAYYRGSRHIAIHERIGDGSYPERLVLISENA